jgi:hypothetical protein
MQAALFRENEIVAFAENKEAAENLVDHLQNWIDGVIPLIKEQREGFYKTELGICLTEFWPTLQFAVFSILAGAYFDAVRNLRFTLESVLDSFRSSVLVQDSGSLPSGRPSYYRIIESLPVFSEEEKDEIKALYGRLSELSHPSGAHLNKLLEEPGRAFTLAYDRELFLECCSFTDRVTGIIFAIMLETWPHIKEKARDEQFFYESLKRLPFASQRI